MSSGSGMRAGVCGISPGGLMGILWLFRGLRSRSLRASCCRLPRRLLGFFWGWWTGWLSGCFPGRGCGAGARAGLLSVVFSLGGQLWERSVRFRQRVGDWGRAASVVRGRLEADHPRGPVEEATVALSDLTGESGTQMALLDEGRDGRHRRLAELVRAVVGGGHALYRVAEVAPWHPVPELRAVQVPLDPSGSDAVRPVCLPVRVAVREGPDHGPVAVRLGRGWHQVARIEERWCFDLWWLPKPVSRFYYQAGNAPQRG